MNNSRTWLDLMKLSTDYDRKARLAPALASFLPLLPLTFFARRSPGAMGDCTRGDGERLRLRCSGPRQFRFGNGQPSAKKALAGLAVRCADTCPAHA